MGGPQSGTLSYIIGILQLDPGNNFVARKYKKAQEECNGEVRRCVERRGVDGKGNVGSG